MTSRIGGTMDTDINTYTAKRQYTAKCRKLLTKATCTKDRRTNLPDHLLNSYRDILWKIACKSLHAISRSRTLREFPAFSSRWTGVRWVLWTDKTSILKVCDTKNVCKIKSLLIQKNVTSIHIFLPKVCAKCEKRHTSIRSRYDESILPNVLFECAIGM